MGAASIRIPAFDAELGVHPAFIVVPKKDLLYVKLVLESYECFGVMRSQDSEFTELKALIVLLLVPDFVAHAEVVLNELAAEVGADSIDAEPEWLRVLRDDLLSELADETSGLYQLNR